MRDFESVPTLCVQKMAVLMEHCAQLCAGGIQFQTNGDGHLSGTLRSEQRIDALDAGAGLLFQLGDTGDHSVFTL